ncbi:MAG: hypothetical protein H7A24_13160 [Leptospiraceae bacterium]|nr:hypothetical protein [Leptospiraceae bacterium]MCP5512826.1 hypothetical protein [Leptospiraceae bacterium]
MQNPEDNDRYRPSPGLLPLAIVAHNLRGAEWDLLQLALKTSGAELVYYDTIQGSPFLKENQILFANHADEEILYTLRDWMITTSIVGRLNESELDTLRKTDIVSFWDLNRYSLTSVLGMIANLAPNSKTSPFLLWTNSHKFNSHISSLLSLYRIPTVTANSPDFALQTLTETSYEILILDWDYNGLDTIVLIRELRKLKLSGIQIPMILGIKDFDKMNVFKDLSAGIREFCPVLFTQREIWELVIRSLPFVTEKPISMLDAELPLLRLRSGKDGRRSLFLDYLKENKLARAENRFSEEELEKMIFRKQFEWMYPEESTPED